MRRQVMAWVGVGAALVLGAGEVRAGDKQKDKSAASEPAKGAGSSGAASSGTASSGTAGVASSQEMRGRVLQASPSRLFMEHMGAVVEFKIDSDAQFSGGNVKSASDLSEGQEVRASFTVENKTTNVAKRISVTEGTKSGTGTSGQAPEQKPSGGERTPSTPGTSTPSEPSTAPAPK